MAKKSNKTEHVLRLITKNDEDAEDDVFFAMNQEPARNDTPTGKAVIQPVIQLAVQPVIREEPEEQEEPQPEVPEEVSPKMPEKASPAEPEEPEETPVEKTEEPAEPAPEESATLKAFREQEAVQKVIFEAADDLVNIAELLAREKIGLVMDRMKVCTCKTCMNDVLALALNVLPTKYVTTADGKQFLQRDSYKRKYETDILAALTKACVRVKASPRH